MKVAIVGSGVAGLSAAHALHPRHDVTVFEAGGHVGGHALTLEMERWGRAWPVDVGFMVYNEATYPEFTRLLGRLGVATQPAPMGFSVSDPGSSFEYCGTDLDGLFAQRVNLLRPSFLRMLADVARFNREAPALAEAGGPGLTLRELADRGRFSPGFRRHYLVPMVAAIWSASERDVLEMPALFFVRFFRNHGLLERPSRQLQWRTVVGGSRAYVSALTRPFASRIRTRTPVRHVRRAPAGVEVTSDCGSECFDEVVLATHADESLRLLAEPGAAEAAALGAFRYQSNEALLHVDATVLPRRRNAWASWNYHLPGSAGQPVAVTYNVSMLQGLQSPEPLLVTLNAAGAVDPRLVLARIPFRHPLFTVESLAAQARLRELSGRDGVHFCGAYLRNGFHEDGCVSGLEAAHAIDRAAVFA